MSRRKLKKDFTLQQLKTNKRLRESVCPTYSVYENKIGEAFKLYIDALIVNDRSINTIKTYHLHINELIRYIHEQFPKIDTPAKMKTKHVESFFTYCQIEKGNSNDTVEHKKIAITQFINFLVEKKIIAENKKPLPEAQVIKTIRRSKQKAPIYMDEYEIVDFFEIFEYEKSKDEIKTLRDYCFYALLISTGLRISEGVNLDLQQLERLRERGTVRIIGKGDKERTIAVKDNAFTEGKLAKFDEYLKLRESYAKRAKTEKDKRALFLSREGTRITTRTMQRSMKNYLDKACLTKNITPHKLRHSFATALIKQGTPLSTVQELLGHSSINTTGIYLHAATDDLRKGVNNLNY